MGNNGGKVNLAGEPAEGSESGCFARKLEACLNFRYVEVGRGPRRWTRTLPSECVIPASRQTLDLGQQCSVSDWSLIRARAWLLAFLRHFDAGEYFGSAIDFDRSAHQRMVVFRLTKLVTRWERMFVELGRIDALQHNNPRLPTRIDLRYTVPQLEVDA